MRMRRFGLLWCFALLSGCTRGEGKILSDFLQHLLQQDIWLRWIVCMVLVFSAAQAFRIVAFILRVCWRALMQSKRFVFGWSRKNVLLLLVLSTIIWIFSNRLIDFMQDIEQRYFDPVYVETLQGISEEHLIAIYEDALGKQVDPYHKQIIQQRTREIAARIQSSPLCIYEAAYLECGLNPFTVRSDQVAAGWIQFTRVGLGGLKIQGQPVRFDQVLNACASKDITFMMDLTEQYLVDKYDRAGRQPLNNTIDLYLALFAPALIGASADKIVYQGYQNPSYYKNDGLDGWYAAPDARGKLQIFHKLGQKDGKITIYEVFLALEAKKARLVSQYLKS
ncbi:MAG: hypothetical protein KGS48_06950 [Bacteroidetes bacterium]|nr:hypothetical protein [Bacteroidota bacterium]